MGCSESAPVMEKTVLKAPPPEAIKTVTKPKVEEAPNFIFGHIAEEEYLFAKVNLASHSFDLLSIPQQFKPHNFSSMLAINNKQYLISGGIDFTLKDITTLCYIYDVPSHTTKQTALMHQARYTHAGLFYQQQIFVFGGRYFGDDDVAILSSC